MLKHPVLFCFALSLAFVGLSGTNEKLLAGDRDEEKTAEIRRAEKLADLKRLEALINELAIEHIPHQYTRNKGWGNQTERWDGLHIRLKDFQLRTKRRTKMVNDGTWKQYSAELVDPENRLKFRLNSVEKDELDRTLVSLSVVADLKLFGRISEWVKGVQIYSLSAEGNASVQLDLESTLATRLDFSKLPPDLYLDPEVNRAKLTVTDFRIKRISKLGGEVAQQVGRSARQILDDKIEEYELKLVDKLNRSIARKKDELKLSVADLVDSEWSRFEKFLIPEKNETGKPEPQGLNPANPDSPNGNSGGKSGDGNSAK